MLSTESLFGTDAEILGSRDFQLLLLANLFPPLGSGLLSPILDSLIEPFGVSPADVGLLISVFTAPPIIMIPVAGLLADRYGRKPILVAALVLFGSAGAATGLTTDFRTALALRVLQGVAFAGITPVIITSIGDLYDTPTETTAQGIRFTGSGLTTAVFPLLAGSLVVLGWQYPFLIYGLSIPAAVAVSLWFQEPTDQRGRDEDTAAAGNNTMTQLSRLQRLITHPRVFAYILARGLPVATWLGFITYNSIVVVRFLDGTPTQSGLLIAVASLAYAATASQAGRLTKRFESQFRLLVLANLCLGGGFGCFLFAPHIVVAVIGVGVTGIGFGIVLSLYRSILTGLAGDSLRGSLVSLGEGFGRVIATATPIAMGVSIAVMSPKIGIEAAVRVAGIGVALLTSIGGVMCLAVAEQAPPVQSVDPE